MALQNLNLTPDLAMAGLGILGDTPPNRIQPPLVDGIHLRWAFKRDLGFPWYGFYLFRRPNPGFDLECLSNELDGLGVGRWPFNDLYTLSGRVSSDKHLVLTDDFPPGSRVEFDLDHRGYLRFDFPPEKPARIAHVVIGFRGGEEWEECAGFQGRQPETGPNPRIEQGMTFEVRDHTGQPRPQTRIEHWGLDCGYEVEITSPRPSSYVELYLTHFAGLATVEAFDVFGNSVGTAQWQQGLDKLTISGTAIARVVVRPPHNEAFLRQVCFGSFGGPTTSEAKIQVTALLGQTLVAESLVTGRSGEIVSTFLEFDTISAIELSPGPAALVELCFEPAFRSATSATRRWEPVPNFPYPLCLPVTQPEYPCTMGSNENLQRARNLARQRILYGDPERFTRAPTRIYAAGRVDIVEGSPIVTGVGTDWGQDLAGQILQVDGDRTAYGIVTVVAPNKLVLTRSYVGRTRTRRKYAINRDRFGQLHDHLLHLVTGGSSSGPMANRFLPVPAYAEGTITVEGGKPVVTGDGTNWSTRLEGLALQVVGDSRGTVSADEGFRTITGFNTAWGPELVGQTFEVVGERAQYTVVEVSSTQQLTLDRDYEGSTGAGKAYRIADKVAYTIARVVSPTQLELDRGYAGPSGSAKSYAIAAGFQSEEPGEIATSMPRQYPMDMVLLAAAHPAVAQMVGLYWVDQEVDSNQAYDYLILANRSSPEISTPEEMLETLQQTGFRDLDGYIVFNKQMAPAPPLTAPEDLQVYALTGSTVRPQDDSSQDVKDVSNNVGLRWDLSLTEWGKLPYGANIMYHLWRADLGNGETPLAPSRYDLITYDPVVEEERPVLVTKSHETQTQLVLVAESDETRTPQRAADWPPFPLHAIDSGLQEGWYSYQVSGIDIFGRHSPNSAAGPWYQRVPPPEPPPWYYQNAPSDTPVHPFAVRLLDKIPPPPPTGVEAYALDPADPTVLRDAAYSSWHATLGPSERDTLVGLRVRWLWTEAHMRQAPDTREFRIYYHPGRMNELPGNTISVSAVSWMESDVETDIPNVHPANKYVGASLRVGPDTFAVVGSDAGGPLRLRVRNGPTHTAGTVSVVNDSPTVLGSRTDWKDGLTGSTFRVADELTTYTILGVNLSNQRLTLDRNYEGPTGSGKTYSIVELPRANAPCALVIPPDHTAGTIRVANGSPTVRGTGTSWSRELIGKTLKVAREPAEYTIIQVFADTQSLMLDRGYEGLTGFDKAYVIGHPLSVDYSVATSWQERYYVVGYDEHVKERIPATRAPSGEPLLGTGATVSGSVVFLNGDPDLFGIRLDADHLFLENDTARPTKVYRLIAVDNVAKTVTVDGAPSVGTGSSPWVVGLPQRLRQYEVFLPAPGDTFRAGLPLTPSLLDPIVYAHIGVSAADDKTHTVDAPKWAAGRWGNRFGNEGRVGPPAKIFRVLRTPPPSPEPPPDAERVFASPADYHSRSFYTYRWRAEPPLKTHIFRALDDAVFNVDWLIRTTRTALDPTNAQHESIFPATWDLARKQAAASQLNAITSIASYAVLSSDARHILSRLPGNEGIPVDSRLQERDWAIRTSRESFNAITSFDEYRSLSDNELQVLAGLPGNERAFTQLTIEPLDPQERDPDNPSLLRWRDRVGPDPGPSYTSGTISVVSGSPMVTGIGTGWSAELVGRTLRVAGEPSEYTIIRVDADTQLLLDRGYEGSTGSGKAYAISYIPQPTLRAYVDTLDGRSTNRYFYRSAYVDGAHNRSSLSFSSPPVWLPDVVPPRTPVITKTFAGDPDPTLPPDNKITVRWASNREPDLVEYQVYRADSEESVRDPRLMRLVHSEVVPPGDPAARPAEVSWTDDGLVGGSHYYYRIVAVDNADNTSVPSDVVSAVVVDTRIPDPPVWLQTTWVVLRDADGGEEGWPADGVIGIGRRPALRLVWTSDVVGATFTVTRRAREELAWRPIAVGAVYTEIAPAQYLLYDTDVSPRQNYSYRIRVTSATGVPSVEFREIEVGRP